MKRFRDWLSEQQDHPMIEVDGVMRHRHNSEGRPIHPTDEGIRNFHRWFGDSKVVDEHGRPKVVYHSSLKGKESFDKHGKFMGHSGVSGISVTDNPHMASRYLDRYASHGWVDGVPNQPFEKHIMPLYVKTENPKIIRNSITTKIPMGAPLPNDYQIPKELDGYDSLIRDDAISRGGSVKHSTAKNAIRGREIVLFHPHQIKSELGNNGDFAHPTKITESV